MTNKEYRNSLPEAEKEKWDNTYTKGHPLKDYINWDAFLNSEDGNEMNFLIDKVDVAEDIYGRKVYVLDIYIDESTGCTCAYVYVPEADEFWKTLLPEDGVYNFDSDIPNKS